MLEPTRRTMSRATDVTRSASSSASQSHPYRSTKSCCATGHTPSRTRSTSLRKNIPIGAFPAARNAQNRRGDSVPTGVLPLLITIFHSGYFSQCGKSLSNSVNSQLAPIARNDFLHLCIKRIYLMRCLWRRFCARANEFAELTTPALDSITLIYLRKARMTLDSAQGPHARMNGSTPTTGRPLPGCLGILGQAF